VSWRVVVLCAVLAAAGAACMAVFPAFGHFIDSIRWGLGLITGFALGDARGRRRRP